MKFKGKSRRRRERLAFSLPVRVQGFEGADHEWTETTRLIDVTPFGARLTIGRLTEPGRLLHLTLPMPRQLRCYDHVEDQYRVWALVRYARLFPANVGLKGHEKRIEIGVAFIGKRPPARFEQDPTTRYEILLHSETGLWEAREKPKPSGTNARSEATRLSLPVEVTIETLDDEGNVSARDQTVTENISRRGAAVFTTLDVERGRFVLLTSTSYQLSVLAVVRACRTGADGIKRLHLEFVSREWPLEGVE